MVVCPLARLAKLRGHAHAPIGTRTPYHPAPVLEIGRDTISTSAAVDDGAGRLWWNAVQGSRGGRSEDEFSAYTGRSKLLFVFCSKPVAKPWTPRGAKSKYSITSKYFVEIGPS